MGKRKKRKKEQKEEDKDKGIIQTYFDLDDFDIDMTERAMDFPDMTDPETILALMYTEAFRRAKKRRVEDYVK